MNVGVCCVRASILRMRCSKIRQNAKFQTSAMASLIFAVLCYCCVRLLVNDISRQRIGRVFRCQDVQGKFGHNWPLKTALLRCLVTSVTNSLHSNNPKKRRLQEVRTQNVEAQKLQLGFVTIITVHILA
jgi:hypothetical protein